MVMTHRTSGLDIYSSVHGDLYRTSMFDWYRLPLAKDHSILVVSTTSRSATYWVIGYTVLITLIFVAVCEIAILMVLTYFRSGSSRTRHAMLVAFYNAGSPSRMLPLMLGYIYNGLFRCRKGRLWAIDWTAVTASCLLCTIAFFLLSGDIVTKFFLGGEALIRGNVAQANPHAIFYPDHIQGTNLTMDQPNALFNAYKGRRAPAVYQAIARKASMGHSNLHNRIYFEEFPPKRSAGRPWSFRYHYELSGYELGLRDAPGLVFAVNGSCKLGSPSFQAHNVSLIKTKPNLKEEVDGYPFFSLEDIKSYGHLIPIQRENYTAPWVYFNIGTENRTMRLEIEKYGGWGFQLIPHTAYRLSRTRKERDPWYETEDNPEWDETLDEIASPYNMPYRVQRRRRHLDCFQNDTFTYNNRSVNSPSKLQDLESYGLKLSPLVRFVFEREFSVPVFSVILGYAPFASLASGVHFVPNERRLDAERANMSTDIRELIETSFVYSREVVRNTILLFPTTESLQGDDGLIVNAAAKGSNHSTVDPNDVDIVVDSEDVAALSVHALIATPAVCVFLWIVVLTWTWIVNSQLKLDNNSASGRYALRRSALNATQLYLFLDEETSKERKWSGRKTAIPYVRDLPDESEQQEQKNPASQRLLDAECMSILSNSSTKTLVTSDFPKPKLVQVSEFDEPNTAEGDGNRVWRWVRENIFRIGRPNKGRYEVRMTKVWDSGVAPAKRRDIREDV